MKNHKITALILAAILSSFSLSSCSKEPAQDEPDFENQISGFLESFSDELNNDDYDNSDSDNDMNSAISEFFESAVSEAKEQFQNDISDWVESKTNPQENSPKSTTANVPEDYVPTDSDFFDAVKNPDGRTLTIKGYTGTDPDLRLPSDIEGFPVTKIEPEVFDNNNTIKSVTVPAELESVNYGMFRGCKNLEKVFIYCENVYGEAFKDCTSLKEVFFGDDVESIDGKAFYNCTSLKKIKLPDKLKNIPTDCFAFCSSLEKVDFSENTTVIESTAFEQCKSLKTFDLSNIVHIGPGAFQDCVNLESVTLSDTADYYGNDLFTNCSKLKSVTVLNDTAFIGINAFGYNFYRDEFNSKKYSVYDDFTIYAHKLSTAEQYAKENDIKFVKVED